MRERRVNMPWAARDWKTCFLACGISLDEEGEPDTFCSSSSLQVPRKKLAFHSKKRFHTNNTTLGNYGKQNHIKESIQYSPKTRNIIPIQKEPSFADEDFIVFQLSKDGLIRVINNDKSGKTEDSTRGYHMIKSSKRNVRTEIILGKHEENIYTSNRDLPLEEYEGNSLITDEGKVKWSSTESEVPHGVSKREENHDSEASKTTSGEQSETTQSDCSSSSFAFPELNWEEIGSPRQMWSQDLNPQLTRQNAYTVLSHSCRF